MARRLDLPLCQALAKDVMSKEVEAGPLTGDGSYSEEPPQTDCSLRKWKPELSTVQMNLIQHCKCLISLRISKGTSPGSFLALILVPLLGEKFLQLILPQSSTKGGNS